MAVSDALIAEYQTLYQVYEAYQEQMLTLKEWSVTVGLSALVAAYLVGGQKIRRMGVVLAALISVPFWIIDTMWKMYQKASLVRLELIEHCVRYNIECVPMQSVASWQASYSSFDFWDWISTAINPNVCLPHIVLLLLGLFLACRRPPHHPSTMQSQR
ncbi:hypothetical protein [Thalassococcus sp. S3]|uniref:hypothetical protein n=1 Tax=Thalassococcus sp. S3 TaxID=2017482 RepID=UPI0010248701|nr:hypothetical protein [Thalassococcus sp. S3]QBF31457.1 hypothetical protein CFI11_09530 [Thalassococcus sp. S3]